MALQKKALKEFFIENVTAPVKTKQVARALGMKGTEYRLLRRLLREMAEEGILARVRRNCYALAEGSDRIRGRLQAVRRGYGFVIPESGGRDIFIKSFNLGDALDGDRVEVRLVSTPSAGKPEGVIERVLGRARRRFVGILQKRKGFSSLLPVEEKIFTEILIPAGEAGGFKNGQKVLVEVYDWGGSRGRLLARVIRALDSPGIAPGQEILLKYELPERFPPAILRQSSAIPGGIDRADLDGREDLRSQVVFTIDPADAKDFDDALSASELPDGDFEVGVHIADVSRYVKEGSAIDREARQRAMSVYLDGAYIPMLPPELSSGICSLALGRDRLTVSVLMRMGPEGEIRNSRLVSGVIHSRCRYDYQQVQAVLDSRSRYGDMCDETVEPLLALQKLSEKRRLKRKMLGALDFDLPEPLVVRGSSGETIDIRRKERLESHRLVEEFMITANELVADRLAKSNLPVVYRIHEEPDPETVENLNYQLKTLDPRLVVNSRGRVPGPAEFSRVIETAEKMGIGELVSSLVIRGMKRALYSTRNIGHFGLASPCYTHFTSPIRRYPDLLVQRLLKRLSGLESNAGIKNLTAEEKLADLCAHWSQREQLIESAERESDSLVQARFMSGHLDRRFEALITSVKPHGFRVQLKEYFVEGFVHVSQLADDYYYLNDNQASLQGRKSGRIFCLGQTIEVILSRCDPELRRIDFVPAGINGLF